MVHRVISCVRLTCPSTPPLVYLADGTCSGPVRLLDPPPASVVLLPLGVPRRPPPDPRFGSPPAACTTRLDRSPPLDVALDAIPPAPPPAPHHGLRGRLAGRAP